MGDGGCCFRAGTMVEMADGSQKKIEDVELGEYLRGVSGAENKVIKLQRPPLAGRHLWSFNDQDPWFTWEHPFLTTAGKWVAVNPDATRDEGWQDEIGYLEEDTSLVHRAGYFYVKALDHASAPEQTVYNFTLDGDNTYFADGFAVHNKGQTYRLPDGTSKYMTQASYEKYMRDYAASQQAATQQAAATTEQQQQLNNQTQNMLNQWSQGGLAVGNPNPALPGGLQPGAPNWSPVTAPFLPNPGGMIGSAGDDIEDSWVAGGQEAGDIYNLGAPQLDPSGYLTGTMANLYGLQDPQSNPYLQDMLATGNQAVAEGVMSSLGRSGRGLGSIDPVTGQVSDSTVNLIDQVGNYTNEFLGNQYQNDMNRAMSASLGGGDFMSNTLQMMQDQPWNNINNYASTLATLRGMPAQQPDDSVSGWDRLIGGATALAGLGGSGGVSALFS